MAVSYLCQDVQVCMGASLSQTWANFLCTGSHGAQKGFQKLVSPEEIGRHKELSCKCSTTWIIQFQNSFITLIFLFGNLTELNQCAVLLLFKHQCHKENMQNRKERLLLKIFFFSKMNLIKTLIFKTCAIKQNHIHNSCYGRSFWFLLHSRLGNTFLPYQVDLLTLKEITNVFLLKSHLNF